jgi:hypothetical protein
VDAVEGRRAFGVDLVGPTRPDYGWQAEAGAGFAASQFTIDWNVLRISDWLIDRSRAPTGTSAAAKLRPPTPAA